MAVRTIKYKVDKDKLYKTYLKVINGILNVPLTDTEIDILELIYNNGNRMDKDFRKVIQTDLKMSEKNLNNYKSKLVKKQTLIDFADYSAIHPSFLMPNVEADNFVLTLGFIINQPEQVEA